MTAQSVLIVTRNFPPLTGGMERLMQHITASINGEFTVTLIGPSGCRKFCPDNVHVKECPANPAGFLALAMIYGLSLRLRRRHHIIFGGSGLVAAITAILAGVNRARSLVHVHGLDIVADNWFYQRLFVPWIRRNDTVIANSRNTRDLAVASGCDPERVVVLNPGVTLDKTGQTDRPTARQMLDLGDDLIILFVGRVIRRKGLAEFLTHSWPDIRNSNPHARLLVVGDTPANALDHDRKASTDLETAIQDEANADHIRFLGAVDDDKLWSCYRAADTLIFPLIDVPGDVEGFGMVAIEASACGTPTVAFAVGGVTDAIEDGVNGRLVEPGDYAAFSAAVIESAQHREANAERCQAYAESYSWPKHAKRLLGILRASTEA